MFLPWYRVPTTTFPGMKMPLADIHETFSAYTAAIKKAHPDFACQL